MKKIVFITWDGPQTSYMEGLFMPILSEVQKKADYSFHVIQFTWSNKKRIALTQEKAKQLNITYTARPIYRKPIAFLGSIISAYLGIFFLKKYIVENKIDVIMPRSIMPAFMANRLLNNKVPIIFDADGLPLQERVDFSGLLASSKQYQLLKKEEDTILQNANLVITRSEKAIDIHLNTIKSNSRDKFSVVFNGRDSEFFKPNKDISNQTRSELNIANNTKVFVYCGSLGNQYGWDDMLVVFLDYLKINTHATFLILTGNPDYALQRIPSDRQGKFIVKSVAFNEVPKYLSIANVAFAIREPKLSMQGVAPIKLGEYLLMGIPTIASVGIGDTEQIVKNAPYCFLYDNFAPNRNTEAVNFIQNLNVIDSEKIRSFGIAHFSIEKSAESYLQTFQKLE
jgi:glycosyltransferase involved in cell wall biosynthesis